MVLDLMRWVLLVGLMSTPAFPDSLPTHHSLQIGHNPGEGLCTGSLWGSSRRLAAVSFSSKEQVLGLAHMQHCDRQQQPQQSTQMGSIKWHLLCSSSYRSNNSFLWLPPLGKATAPFSNTLYQVPEINSPFKYTDWFLVSLLVLGQ